MKHKTQLTPSQKNSEEESLMRISSSSNRSKNLPELWKSGEPSFIAIKKEYGEAIMQTSILAEISRLVSLVGAELNEVQMDYLLEYISSNYPYFTISDIGLIGNKMVQEKVYHKPSLQTFIVAIENYDRERDEFASYEMQKVQFKREKDTKDEIERFNKGYRKIMAKAKKPQKTQKNKDADAMKNHIEKIRELSILYPDERLNEFLSEKTKKNL